MVRHGERFLHHNYVVALLNDLFGIQARGGCSCAGPYGHRLLDIDLTRSKAYEQEILRGCEGVKPGWVRVNFPYFVSPRAFDYILDAVRIIADDGWKLLPRYTFEPETGLWRHQDWEPRGLMSLDDLEYGSGRLQYRSRHIVEPETVLADHLADARRILNEADPSAGRGSADEPELGEGFRALRWFVLPSDLRDRDEGGA